jgi:hypothetical protein
VIKAALLSAARLIVREHKDYRNFTRKAHLRMGLLLILTIEAANTPKYAANSDRRKDP